MTMPEELVTVPDRGDKPDHVLTTLAIVGVGQGPETLGGGLSRRRHEEKGDADGS